MNKQVPNNFIGYFSWTLLFVLVTTCTMASAFSVTDTCRHPEPPVITGSANSICRGKSVTLAATGCAGTVIWSNGETGFTIQVKPQQTTRYTAICRALPGCISCFADVWKVTVNTPEAPVIRSSAAVICANTPVTLTAENCTGTIHWSDQTTGPTWTGTLTQTTSFQATCEKNNCLSNPSLTVSVQVAVPSIPVVSVSSRQLCTGQSSALSVTGCLGTIRWMDGVKGANRIVMPEQTSTYRAVCELGSCRSDSSEPVSVRVQPAGSRLIAQSIISNVCPFQTADLSISLTGTDLLAHSSYQYRMGPAINSPVVQSPGAVLAGTYYIFGRDAEGCYTNPAPVTVKIVNCANAIPPCLSNPPTLAIRLDSLDWMKGVIRLTAQPGGSAQLINWQSDGEGLFTDTGLTARYLLSETDRQRARTQFTLSTPDPDGEGPCTGVSVQQVVGAPARELIGLSKKASEPVWLTSGGTNLVELTYQLTVVNAGKHAMTGVTMSDDLDAAFSSSGAVIHLVTARADNGLVLNSAYTGRGRDTTLLDGATLAAGQQSHIWLTVQLDVSQANTLTFINKATAWGVDVNGASCRDRSTNGIDADPDQNGDPGDNDEPTLVTLHSLRPEEDLSVFIPEGFSPNGDGINDLFVIQRLPATVTVQLDVFNRWGHLVYRNTNYRNEWDGTPNQGVSAGSAKTGLPDGTYYYQIRLSDGREFIRFLTLAR